MNIALIGYGKMGRMIEQICKERGHNIVSIIDFCLLYTVDYVDCGFIAKTSAMQKDPFYTSKGLLLHPKRTPFAMQKDPF